MSEMRDDLAKRIILLGAIVPLMIGMVLYYLLCPEVLFVQYMDRILARHVQISFPNTFWGTILRYYMFDFIWGFSLGIEARILFTDGNDKNSIRITFALIIVFEVILEISQLSPNIAGTFDAIDILVESIATTMSYYIVSSKKGQRNEKG